MAANDVPCCEPMFWLYLIICVALVAFAGLMSGLTLGLMSLSIVDLEVLSRAGNPQDRKNAAKILPLVKNQHLLLCTLLIGNSLAMEALPIFLDALLPAWGAILISVTLILAFGEIIPQAICSRYGLSVGAKLSVIVRLLVLLVFPLSYPISKLLDWLLGKGHAALLRRAELKTFVDMHGNKEGKGGELTNDETTIITGALDMTLKTAEDAMTPFSNVFSLDINSKLDEKTLGLIMSRGHSRVPVYSGSTQNIIGLILFCVQSMHSLNVLWLNEIIRAMLPHSKVVKNLIKYRPEDGTPIKDLAIRKIPRVPDKLPLYDVMNEFQKGHSHMAIVVRSNNEVKEIAGRKSKEEEEKKRDEVVLDVKTEPVPSEDVIGIITLEDVMEELLQEEIWDETDEYVVVHNKLKINMVPSRRSSLRSPMTSPLSSNQPSPLSSYNQTPILRSPIPTFMPSPFARPSLSSSPATYSRNNSPIAHSTPLGSPSSYKISRKSYEKLRQPFG